MLPGHLDSPCRQHSVFGWCLFSTASFWCCATSTTELCCANYARINEIVLEQPIVREVDEVHGKSVQVFNEFNQICKRWWSTMYYLDACWFRNLVTPMLLDNDLWIWLIYLRAVWRVICIWWFPMYSVWTLIKSGVTLPRRKRRVHLGNPLCRLLPRWDDTCRIWLSQGFMYLTIGKDHARIEIITKLSICHWTIWALPYSTLKEKQCKWMTWTCAANEVSSLAL